MKNNLWVFGCSFSSGYLNVKREQSYGNLIAKELNYNIRNMAYAGMSNDKLLYDLISVIDEIKENDVIIYQFSSFDRIGHFTNENQYSYFSSAGLPQLGIDHKMKEEVFRDFKKTDLEILLEYIFTWQPMRIKFSFDNTIQVLKHLKKIKNVKYITMYMVSEYFKIDDTTLVLPTKNDSLNVSINNYLVENKLTVSDDFPEDFEFLDSHPGVSGHLKLKELIIDNFLNDKK